MATAVKEFYRKPLPSSCIDFASSEGKSIFKEALSDGGMNCFFNLAAQFRTQDEPAYCGLSTLVMVLNALSVDPGRVWKGPWRWYHENMLDCCVPLDLVKAEGISLFNFSCLALCNGLDVDMVQALSTVTVEQFRDTVKNVSKSDSQVLVCSYSRRILGQTGDGHFSPIGGYHAGRDLVLIFDVARFKYPPHWVAVDLLWKSMQGLEKETGQPRGWLTLSRTLHTGNPTILFKISENFNLVLPSDMKPELSEVLRLWHTWLTSQCHGHHEKREFLEILVSKFLSLWCSECFPGLDQICTMRLDVECCNRLSEHHKCAICDLLRSLEKQPLFSIIDESLFSGEHVVRDCGGGLVNLSIVNEKLCCEPKDGVKNFPRMKLTHFATIMLLAWPYPQSNSRDHNSNFSHADFCIQYVGEEMAEVTEVLENEVKLLRAQLSTVFTYFESLKKAEGLNKGCCEVAQCKKNDENNLTVKWL